MTKNLDSVAQSDFRKTLERKLEVASVNNTGLIMSWEISPRYDHVRLICDRDVFQENVVGHVATSLTRLLGVGKRLGFVERNLGTVTIECVAQKGLKGISIRTYSID